MCARIEPYNNDKILSGVSYKNISKNRDIPIYLEYEIETMLPKVTPSSTTTLMGALDIFVIYTKNGFIISQSFIHSKCIYMYIRFKCGIKIYGIYK